MVQVLMKVGKTIIEEIGMTLNRNHLTLAIKIEI